MVLLNLSKSYLDLAEPFLKGLQSEQPKRLLPSRQQLEYVLIRTQSAAKLICEALHYSRETFCYLIQRLKVGHMILNLMMATSVTARLNILFKGILVLISDFYRQVYKWLEKLKEGHFKWALPLDLPEDLLDWLKSEGDLTDPKQLPTEQLSFLKNIFEKQKGISQASKDMVIDIETDEEECTIVEGTSGQIEDIDYGELVSRDIGHIEVVSKETEPSEIPSLNEEHADVSSTTQEENLLLQKIKEAKTFKQLFNIWKNIEEWSDVGALPGKLSEKRYTKIKKMFATYREERSHIKSKLLTEEERKRRNKRTTKKYKTQFCKLLRLTPQQPEDFQETPAPTKSKDSDNPKSLKELVNLYKDLYIQLETVNAIKKCTKLKKMFKARKSDIKLLLSNDEKGLAKQLIACTSKILLTKYVL